MLWGMLNPISEYEQDLAVLKKARNKKLLMLGLSLCGLLAFIFWEGLLLKSFTLQDTLPPSWTESIHMDAAWNYWRDYQKGRLSVKRIISFSPVIGTSVPPLYPLSLIFAYSSLSPARAALWVNYAYFMLLCLAVFACSYFFRPDYTAVLAAVSFCASPIVWRMMTTQLWDLPAAALAAAALWAFLISEGFAKWLGSLLFGFLFAAGMLMKESFFSYFIPILVVAIGNLKFPNKRWKITAAMSLSFFLFSPWYVYHLPALMSRLFQASSSMAVPFLNGGVIDYLFKMMNGLGPFLWALGLAGILTAQYKRHRDWGWLILATVVSSYVFWTLVPNKELRFLLPGISGLAVAAISAWPNMVLWFVAGFQILTIANLNTHWIEPFNIPTPLHAISLFPQNPPLNQRWYLKSVLKTAAQLSDLKRVLNPMTIVSNNAYFNEFNFKWMNDVSNLKQIVSVPPQKRLCEFSEFLLLKTDHMGPASDTLENARETVFDPDGWFLSAYEQAAQWRLPDDSLAILFQQKRPQIPPLRKEKIHFQFYSVKNMEAENVTLDLGKWDPQSASYPNAALTASILHIDGIAVSNLKLGMKDFSLLPVLNQQKKWDGNVRFLKMNELDVFSAEVSSSDLSALIQNLAPDLVVNNLSIDKDLNLSAHWEKIPISARLSVQLTGLPPQSDQALLLSLEALRLGPVPIPRFLLKMWAKKDISLAPRPGHPFKIVPSGLTISQGFVSIP